MPPKILVPSPMEAGVFVTQTFAKLFWEHKRIEYEVTKKLDDEIRFALLMERQT